MAKTHGWASFLAWFAVGVAGATGLLAAFAAPIFLGLLALAGVGAAALGSNERARAGLPGVASGLSIPFLYVAYLNRDGPGNVCSAHAGTTCTAVTQESSPWPWVAVGLIVLAVGVVVFLSRTHRAGGA